MKWTTVAIAIALAWNTTGKAQHKSEITLSGKLMELSLVDSTRRPMVNAPIEIWAKDSLMMRIYSQEKGRYKIGLPFFQVYSIRYGGEAYITKVVQIDASDFAEVSRERGFELQIDIELFKTHGETTFDFLQHTPFARARYNAEFKSLEWDIRHIEAMDQRVAQGLQKLKTK